PRRGGQAQLTVDQMYSDEAFNRAYAFNSTPPANMERCNGMADRGYKFSYCGEWINTSQPGGPPATAQQKFDSMMSYAPAKAGLLDGNVTVIGAGVAHGNHTGGPSGEGA